MSAPINRVPDALMRLGSVWRPGGREFGWVVVSSFALNVLALAVPLLMLQLYDRILPSHSLDTLTLLLIGTALAVLAESVLRLLRSYAMVWSAARFEHGAMTEGFSRLLAPGRDMADAYGLADRFKSIVSLRDHCSGQTMMQFLDLPFTVLFLVLVALIGGWLVLIPIVGVLLFAWLGWAFALRHRTLYRDRNGADRRRANFIIDTLGGIHTIKSLAMEAFMLRRYERLHEACAELTRRLASALDLASGVGNLFSPLMTVLVVAAGGYMVMQGRMTNGELAACLLLVTRSLGPLQRIGSLWIAQERVRALYDEVKPLFAGPSLEPASPDEDDSDDEKALPGPGLLELKAASFRFPKTEEDLLHDINLTLKPGECVVVKGANGSGRSSLLRMMAGLVPTREGVVLLDGQPLADLPPAAVRDRIAYVPENALVFQGTVLENITGFDASRTERALQVAKALGLDRFVSRLPRGWDSYIGDAATETLPVGHRQRIAMVRALARNARVVLMDAANISMDSEGDAALRRFLEANKGRTSFVIVTNRPAMERLADRIYLLENGGLLPESKAAGTGVPAPGAAPAGGPAPGAQPIPVALPSSAMAPGSAMAAAGGPGLDTARLPLPDEDADTESAKQRWERMERVAASTFNRHSDLAGCTPVLLRALGWSGSDRDLAEAFPYFEETLDLPGMRNSMARLGYESGEAEVALQDLDRRLLPCLYLPRNGPALVLLKRTAQGMLVFDPQTQGENVILESGVTGQAVFFKPVKDSAAQAAQWVRQVFGRMRPLVGVVMLSAVIYGLLLLPVPLYTMSVYSSVIPSGSTANLMYLLGGAVTAIALGTLFVVHRAEIMSFVAGRLDFIFGSSVFKQILSLPPAMSERAAIGAQVARLNSFEAVRDLFTGPMASTVAEAPALVAFVVAMAIINPAALGVIAITLLVYGGVYWLFHQNIDRGVAEMVRRSTVRQEFLIETATKLRAIQDFGGERTWQTRFREISGAASMAGYRVGRTSALLSSGGYLISTLGILGVVLVSVFMVYTDKISVGAVIASMMLAWRLVGPVQMGFMNLTRIDRIRSSIVQMDRLMSLRGERQAQGQGVPTRDIRGKVELDRVSFRYTMESDPALLGVSLVVEPGTLVAIVGENGSGKSTLLKMLSGMYAPQAGSVRLDDTDIRQMDPITVRRAIGYVPQETALFRGTIAQNLRLVRPGATDEEINRALALAGALNEIALLPDGMNTRPGDGRSEQMPSSLRQKLALARAYLSGAPILLFDEPANTLDFEGDRLFMETLKRFRGRSTVFLVTHRPSHIRMADTVVVLQGGFVRFAGAPAEALQRLGFA